MTETLESMVELRVDLMVSPVGDSEPTLREAHFLKPIATSIEGSVSDILLSSFISEPKLWPLTINFNGWCFPSKKWIGWVDSLRHRYESVWRQAGILEAVMSSKFNVKKNQDLAFGVAEKWCSNTNTFLFPWGEATITLEDLMILGGFPVLGDPIFSPLKKEEMKEVEERLIIARKEPWRSKKSKASTSAFMDIFFNSGSDIEHESFLATWLSMFVFPYNGLINKSVFPIAVHLSRGNKIALAPAVLASLYKDLGLLKETMVSLTRNAVAAEEYNLEITLQLPFYLVQVWVWERFNNLQPQPNLINHEDPLLSRWDKVEALKIDNVRLALDLGMDDFLWRPYGKYADKCMFYPEKETWIPFESDLNQKILSFVTCTRISELVGIDSTIKKYFPHRVAMQFGMDQDVPDFVTGFNVTNSIAWENYCRPISDRILYFPSRHFEADVTMRYVRWWKQSVFGHQDFAKNVARGKRSSRPRSHGNHVSKVNRSVNDADVPPGFTPKFASNIYVGKSCDDGLGTMKSENDADVTACFLPKFLKSVPCGNSVMKGNGDVHEDVRKLLPLMKPVAKVKSEPSIEEMQRDYEDANGSIIDAS